MAQFPILRLTHAGQEMAGMSQGGGKLTFVRVDLGDGQLKEEDSIEALTDLKRSVMQLPLQGYLNEGNGKARLRFVIDNSALTVGFHNREVGIFAKIDNGAERLYAYTNAGNYADWIPSKETPIDGDIVDLHIVIGNAANVTIQTVSGAYATKIEIEEHRTASELDHPDGSVTTPKLRDAAVTGAKIANKAIGKEHLKDGVVDDKAPIASPALTGTPTVPTASKGTSTDQIASTAFVAQAIAALVNSAPGALDTLQELAAALGNDANFATTVTNALAGKVSKSGDTMTGPLNFALNKGGVTGKVATDQDYWKLWGMSSHPEVALDINSYGGRTSSIYFRRFIDGVLKEQVNLIDDNGNASFPKTVIAPRFQGEADSANDAHKLGGQSLQWIINQINAANTGIVASNLEQNGWARFANGLIIQWMYCVESNSDSDYRYFPIKFPNALFYIGATSTYSNTWGNVSWAYKADTEKFLCGLGSNFDSDNGVGKMFVLAFGR